MFGIIQEEMSNFARNLSQKHSIDSSFGEDVFVLNLLILMSFHTL